MTAVRTAQRTSTSRASTARVPAPGSRQPARPQLAIAEAPRRLGGNRLLFVAAVVVFLLAVLTISVSQALQVQAQDQLDDLQRQIVVQKRIAEVQRLELAELQSPVRIVEAASERLGMVPPSEIVYLRSDPGDDELIAVPGGGAVGDTPSAGVDR